jgi:dihydroorotate dehydrogenase electron transfer subunit
LCVEDFEKFDSNIFIATEDGSMGYEGTVIDLLLSQRKEFDKNEKYHLYACGPAAMLRALAGSIKAKNVISQASLEARMGCGFGACWGCVVKTRSSKMPYQRVCKDGPVFRLEDIVWE